MEFLFPVLQFPNHRHRHGDFWPAVSHRDSYDLADPFLLGRRRSHPVMSLFSQMQPIFKADMATPHTEVSKNGLEVLLPLEGFNEKDVKVEVQDGALKVTALHEEKNEKGETVSVQKMSQLLSLPEYSNPDGIQTKMGEDGVFRITIPKKPEAIQAEEQASIQQNGGQSNKAQDMELAVIPVEGYNPDELSVQLTARGMLEVSGKHEEKSADGTVTSTRQFCTSFSLPKNVNKEAIRSDLSRDGGQLRIMAPVSQAAVACEKNIPITFTST